MPLCVEVTLVQKNRTVGYLSLFIGTDKKGKLKVVQDYIMVSSSRARK